MTFSIYQNNVSVLSISPEWVTVWNWLTNKPNNSVDTCADLREKYALKLADDEFLGYLEYFSKAGAIGLFPEA